ncbi:MFS transporter [Candidatus Woesebacteria bacterium]|nr:MFS transporter [Candidatus Woesebacteria bacterium]MCD8506777.1 MFS transporter [Candidatus Woesebacteria bacterium]MCD8527686.1 MFS transporter [Candidatus Woesebacteria bacterium]MCD8546345.1 MFS transporter [Candidatus Woesebacteria bacterium]
MKLRSKSLPSLLFTGINPVIRLLIASDILIVGAAGMFAPLFALFVEDFIVGGNALVVSIAMGIFLIARSVLQIPVANTIDAIKGETDDYLLMVVFSVLSGLSLLLYLVIEHPWQLYLVQLFLGISTAISAPTYMAIFTRHIDHNREGTEWGVYNTLTDLGSAALAVIAGYIATVFGFPTLIWIMSATSVAGALVLVPIRSYLRLRR